MSTGATAQSVRNENGNVIYRDAAGRERQLTSSGLDSTATLSPNGQLVAFVVWTPDRLLPTAFEPQSASELWIIDTAGLAPRLLVQGHAGEPGPREIETSLVSMTAPVFSPDGARIYVESTGWVTSSALHVVEVRTGRERYVTSSTGFEVLTARPLRGALLVWQHLYHAGGGSFEGISIYSSAGRRLAYITEDEAPGADRRVAAARAGRPLPNKRPR